MDHLLGGMDPRVGATGPGQRDRGPGDPAECSGQRPGHRALALLSRESTEAGTVVRQREPPPDGGIVPPPRTGGVARSNSMRAIGALSPMRFPSLRMRV